VILKSYIVEQNIKILESYQATLIYGQNDGIKDDIKKALINQNKSFEILNFFEQEILKDKDIIYQNIVNESLFSKEKTIFIHEATDKIFDPISECLKKENDSVKILIFSGILEKKSKLRSLFEKSKNLAIFPCYEDNERTLINYVNKELRDFKGLSGEIINFIISNSNMDRRIIKSELTKIKDFFLTKIINKEQILEVLNIKTDTSFDEIRDNALKGEKVKINKLLCEIELLNEDTFFYLNNLNYRVMRLREIMKISGCKESKYEATLEGLKPVIFWKDKPVIIQQLKKWDYEGLTQLATRIGETEIMMKLNSDLRKDIIIKNLIISLTNKASSIYS